MPRKSARGRQRRYDLLDVLLFVARYQQENDQKSPSQRQIKTALGMTAPSVVHNLLHRLQQRGLLIVTNMGRGRSAVLTLTQAGREAVAAQQAGRTPAPLDAPEDES